MAKKKPPTDRVVLGVRMTRGDLERIRQAVDALPPTDRVRRGPRGRVSEWARDVLMRAVEQGTSDQEQSR